MRRTLSLLLVVGLLVACATALAAPGRGQGQGRGSGSDDAPAHIGEFVAAGSTVTGEHVSFSYDATGIQDFTTRNVTLFSITVTPDEGESRGRAPRVEGEGAMFRVRTDDFDFRANDNPGAVARMQADGTVAIAFAEGVTLARDPEDDTVAFSIDGVNGTLRGDDLERSGSTITSRGSALLFLDAPRGRFDVHREVIGDAIARGHVGAEASFNARPDDVGAPSEARAAQQDVVSYGNVTMTTIKAERGNLTVQVEGHGFDGRVLVLNVDGRMLGADRADKLDITLDNESIEPASSLEDALDPDDDGYSPEYYVVYDPGVQAFQVIVTVPHYSVHTLTVATLVDILPPSVTAGILVGVLAIVPMAYVLFRRK